MILTCPNCATRYTVDDAKFPAAGRKVRCAKCTHVWFQPGPTAEPVPVAAMAEAPAGAPISAPASSPVSAPAASSPAASARIVERVAEAMPAPAAAADFVPPRSEPEAAIGEQPKMGAGARLALIAGWVGLILVVLLIGVSAVRYRQEISTVWPQSAGVYKSLGLPVNAHGIDIVKVDSHRESEDGQVVLAVTGRILNAGSRELPVPQSLRVTLSDSANHELYHWTFAPSAQTLKPGQSVPFLTRLSSPPAAARHLEVRFAKEGP